MSQPFHGIITYPPQAPVRRPIFKDGNPGWIVGEPSTLGGDFFDIELCDGRMTFVRLPDYGGRITPRVEGQS